MLLDTLAPLASACCMSVVVLLMHVAISKVRGASILDGEENIIPVHPGGPGTLAGMCLWGQSTIEDGMSKINPRS